MNRTAIAAAMAAAALALGVPACTGPKHVSFPAGSTMDRLQQAGKITVGVKYDQPGLGFRNLATGKPEGFDIKLAQIVAAELGLGRDDIDYVETVSRNREAYLESGRVDIVIASYSITPERRRKVGQAGPYYVTHQQLLVRKGEKDRISGPEQLPGVRVCSVAGSTSLATVQKKYRARPVPVATYTECVQRLLNKSVDAVTTDDAILLGYAALQPDKLEIAGRPFTEERYGIGYRKGDQTFCQFLTDAIRKAEDNGEWEKAFKDTLGKARVPTPEKPTPEPCQP